MQCLKCGKKMKKKAVVGILAEFCKECGLFWLDTREFALAVAHNSNLTIGELRKRMEEERCTEKLKFTLYNGLCRQCGGQVSTCIFNDIRLDKCETCGGMYFERAELNKCMHNCKSKEGWLNKLFRLMR